MILANIDFSRELVNGQTGTLVEVAASGAYARVKLANGDIEHVTPAKQWLKMNHRGYVRQGLPLMPCYAMTVHKSQGQTCDYLITTVSTRFWEPGQAAVVLSRVRSLAGLHLIPLINVPAARTGDKGKRCNVEPLSAKAFVCPLQRAQCQGRISVR